MRPSSSSSSRHVDLELLSAASPKFFSRVPVQRPVTDRCATKSLSPISVLRFCPRVVLKQLQMTKMVVTPLLILKCSRTSISNCWGTASISRQISQTWTDGVRKLRFHAQPCANMLKISSKNLNLRENCGNSLSVPGAAIEVQLVTSCKSHEPRGAVKFRSIHSAPRDAFAGLAMWCGLQNNTENN